MHRRLSPRSCEVNGQTPFMDGSSFWDHVSWPRTNLHPNELDNYCNRAQSASASGPYLRKSALALKNVL